jgi:hypothetical protein
VVQVVEHTPKRACCPMFKPQPKKKKKLSCKFYLKKIINTIKLWGRLGVGKTQVKQKWKNVDNLKLS